MPLCPHCNSKYVTHTEKKENFEKTTDVYYCQSCKKHFNINVDKQSAEGIWLMTVYSDENYRGYNKVLEIYKSESGFMINQKVNGKYLSKAMRPSVEVKYNQYINSYSIWFGTFSSLNDAGGAFFTAEKIEMNPELTAKALENEAMRIIHSKDNVFLLGKNYKETTLINDVVIWISHEVFQTQTSSGKSGCYVATAVYGSYDCPQVWILRRFRDNTLAKNICGRTFIRAYYTISPTLVKFFGETKLFKDVWRRVLDRMISRLKENGVEDTPYNDREW